jgi:hypothetical protein
VWGIVVSGVVVGELGSGDLGYVIKYILPLLWILWLLFLAWSRKVFGE